MAQKKRHTTPTEMVGIIDLLKLHVIRLAALAPGDPPQCEYRGDWTDDKIAKAVAPDLNANHVLRFRLELYGSLAKPVPEQDRLTALETAHAELLRRFEKLCADLGDHPGRGQG